MNVTAVCGARCAQEWRDKDVPICREDPLPLSHKQEVEAECHALSVASPFFSRRPSFFFLEELCKCFLPLLQFIRVLFSLLRRLEQHWACKIWDLVSRILNSFQSYCLNMQNWEFPSFPSLKKSKLGKPARNANASWQTASKHEFHIRTATVQQKPFPESQRNTLVLLKSTSTFRLCFPAWVSITCPSGGCSARGWLSHAPLVRNSCWYLGWASVPCQPDSERSKPGGRCLFRYIPGVSSWLSAAPHWAQEGTPNYPSQTPSFLGPYMYRMGSESLLRNSVLLTPSDSAECLNA